MANEWNSDYPNTLDTDTPGSMPTISNGTDSDASQINSVKKAVIELEGQVGSDGYASEPNSLRKRVTDLESGGGGGGGISFSDIDGYAEKSWVRDGYTNLTTFNNHSSRHEIGGADAIKLDDLDSPEDNTDLNVNNSAHGLCPKLDDDTDHYLRGDGYWTTPNKNTLNQAYDQGGGEIVANNGPILITTTNDEALDIDGYYSVRELSSDPISLSNKGLVYAKDIGGNTALFYMDSNNISSRLDGYTNAGNTLDQAYDQGGAGVGREIGADSGAVIIDAYGDDALDLDGYIFLREISDPTYFENKGGLYSKDVDGYTELHYIDNYGSITQITDDGYLDTLNSLRGVGLFSQSSDPSASPGKGFIYAKDISGNTELFYKDDNGDVLQLTNSGSFNTPTGFTRRAEGYDELITTTGNEIELILSNDPIIQTGTDSGYSLDVFQNGIKMKYVPVLGIDKTEWTYDDIMNTVEFVAPGTIGTWYSAKYTTIGLVDAYLVLEEMSSDPTPLYNSGLLYTKDIDGYTELFYMDNYGTYIQVTSDGYLNTYESLEGVGLFSQEADPSYSLDKGYVYAKEVDGYTELHYMDDYGLSIQITDKGSVTGGGGGGGISFSDIDGYAEKSWVRDGYTNLTAFNNHSSRHESGGSDAIKLDDLDSPEDNTNLNVSDSAHGLCPKLDNDTDHYLRGDGSWATPAGGGGGGFSGYEEEYTATGGDENFTLSATPATNANMLSGVNIVGVFRNGQRLRYQSSPSTGLEYGYTAPTTIVCKSLIADDIITVVYST